MGKPWTGAQEISLRKAVESGMGRVALLALFAGRNADSLRRKCFALGIKFPPPNRTFNYEDRVYEPSPDQIVRASGTLRDATQRLLESMTPGLRAEVLCPTRKVEPGQERIYKTASIERLAA